MGVGSGYTQADIIEFAKALTGWTIGSPQTARLAGAGRQPAGAARPPSAPPRCAGDAAALGETVFMEPLHEPGARTVLGKTYGGAKQQAAAILDDLAMHPATARHIATKLVRHFVADQPPASAVAEDRNRLARNRTAISPHVASAVVDLDEAWAEQPQKFKTPEELLVSVARAAGAEAAFGRDQRAGLPVAAQQPFSAPSPAGWPDDTASWSGSDAIKKRLEWANAVSRRMVRGETPTAFLDRALGPIARREDAPGRRPRRKRRAGLHARPDVS